MSQSTVCSAASDASQQDNAHPVQTAEDLVRQLKSDVRPRDMLRLDSLIYPELLNKPGSQPVKTAGELMMQNCCENDCNLHLSAYHIIKFRGGMVQALGAVPSSVALKKAIHVVLLDRSDTTACRNGASPAYIDLDTRLDGNVTLCRLKFLDLIGIGIRTYLIASGHPYLQSRTGAKGYLSDNTIRALARVSVHASPHGQYSPQDEGGLYLHRGESPRHFLRTTATGARLTRGHVREFVGLRLLKSGLDSFMHCDTCQTLAQKWKKMQKIVHAAGKGDTSCPPSGGHTAVAHRQRVVSRRKATLHLLLESRYRASRTRIALKNGVRPEEVSVDACVPDEDTEVRTYCELVNSRGRKDNGMQPPLQPFTIDPGYVHSVELADLDGDGVLLYLGGQLSEVDLAAVPTASDGDYWKPVWCSDEVNECAKDWERPVSDNSDIRSDAMDSPCNYVDDFEGFEKAVADYRNTASRVDKHTPEYRRRLGILTSAELISSLRGYHTEHVIAERLMTYSAFETAGQNPRSVLAFAADGISKDKTKIPRLRDKGKKDATVNRLECHVTCLQMAVPGRVLAYEDGAGEETAGLEAKRASEVARRAELRGVAKEVDRLKRADKMGYRDHPLVKYLDDGRAESAEKDAAAASSFGLKNHDFVYPFGFGGVPKVDSLISNLIHILRSDDVKFIPPIIAIVVDNATTNKSIAGLRGFGLLLEQLPGLQEIHLMYATVGHTHNAVDAHFGRLCNAMKQIDIGTPRDLGDCIDGMANSKSHLDFDYYVFADDIKGGYNYKWILDQHHFLLFRDGRGDIKLETKSFLRFAEPLANRVNHVLKTCRELVPRSEEEKEEEGVYLFAPREDGRQERAAYAETVFPLVVDIKKTAGYCATLETMLKTSGIDSAKRSDDLKLMYTGPPRRGQSLADACTDLRAKSVSVPRPSERGTAQEMAIAQYMRLLGRKFKSNHLQIEARKNELVNITSFMRELFRVLRQGNDGDGGLCQAIMDKIAGCEDDRFLRKVEQFREEYVREVFETAGDVSLGEMPVLDREESDGEPLMDSGDEEGGAARGRLRIRGPIAKRVRVDAETAGEPDDDSMRPRESASEGEEEEMGKGKRKRTAPKKFSPTVTPTTKCNR